MPGSIVLPLLLVLAISGFILVKNVATRSFAESQAKVEENIQDRYNPFSTRYLTPPSAHMDKVDSWNTYENKALFYKIKHPNVWPRVEKPIPPGSSDYFEVALSDKVSYSVTVQSTFVIGENTPKIKSKSGDFYFYQDEQNAKSAVSKKNGYYYIIRLKEDRYFKDETEFKGTFYQLLKNFEFSV